MNEHLIRRVFAANIAKTLEVQNAPVMPLTVSDGLVLVKSIDSSFAYVDFLFKSFSGGAGVLDIQLDETPAGLLEYPIAIEVSHNEAIARPIAFGVRWPRAGVTTSVALVNMETVSQNFVVTLPRAERLALPPAARIYANAIGLLGSLTLKMCYVTVPLGDVVPS